MSLSVRIKQLPTRATPLGTDWMVVDSVAGEATEKINISNLAAFIGVLPAYTENFGNGVDTDYIITHNLGTQDVIPIIRRIASPYDFVAATIEATTINTITIKLSSIPSIDQYRIIIK